MSEDEEDEEDEELELSLMQEGDYEEMLDVNRKSKMVNNIADQALFSFLKIVARLRKSSSIRDYNNDPDLNEQLPGYSVQMGFGLHYGWAIEGTIGSEYKIDASYLCPNVNLASRLEAATKQYGVPFLFSGELYSILSPDLRSISTEIDTVTVKGSSTPMRLYTVRLRDDEF